MNSVKLVARRCTLMMIVAVFMPSVLLYSRHKGDTRALMENRDVIDGLIIVKLEEDIPVSSRIPAKRAPSLETKMLSHGVSSVDKIFPYLTRDLHPAALELQRVYYFHYLSGENPKDVARSFASIPSVEYAEPKYLQNLFDTPVDPAYAVMLQFPLVNAPDAWDVIKGECGDAVIAVVDGGTDWRHEDLISNIWTNPEEIPDNGIDDDENGFIDDNHGWNFADETNDPTGLTQTPGSAEHGTHVAGIAAGATNNGTGIASISWNCTFMPVNAASPEWDGMIEFGYEGIVYAAANGADVINASWGGVYESQFARDVIAFAHSRDALVVSSAGNAAANNDNAQHAVQVNPQNIPGVLSVGATAKDSDRKASFSNYGVTIDVFAPGDVILSTIPDNQYGELYGTSMASPMVAGLCALVKTRHPEWTYIQVREQVRVTCDDIDAANPVLDGLLGKGRINAFRAVTETGNPSIRICSLQYTDRNRDGIIHPGDTVDVEIDFINFLDDASNIRILIHSLDEILTPVEEEFLLPFLGTGDTVRLDFVFAVKAEARNGDLIRFVVELSSYGYSDRDFFSFKVNPGAVSTASHSTSLISTSITAEGNIGWLDLEGSEGNGFVYRGQNHLYEAGLVIGRSENQVSDCIRGEDISVQENDFSAVTDLEIISPGVIFGFNEEGYVQLEDASAVNPMGITVNQLSMVGLPGIPTADGMMGLIYSIENTTPETIANLHAGLFCDWDVNEDKNDHAAFDAERRMSMVFNSAENPTRIVATKLLSQHDNVSHRAIDNDSELNDGFKKAEKWAYLSGGIQTTSLTDRDVSTLLSVGPITIPPYETVEVAFLIAVADRLLLLQLLADVAQEFFDVLTPVDAGLPQVPAAFALDQNYPNPFNLSTNICFHIPVSCGVRIDVFDMAGRRVRQLVSKAYTPGTHVLQWDGQDDSGRTVAAGLYLFRMEAGDFIDVAKGVLMK